MSPKSRHKRRNNYSGPKEQAEMRWETFLIVVGILAIVVLLRDELTKEPDSRYYEVVK